MNVSKIKLPDRFIPSLGNILTLIAMAGALVSTYVSMAGDNADTKRRVTEIESGIKQDKMDAKEDRREIKNDIKETKETVQQILRKLDVMESRQRDARHRDR